MSGVPFILALVAQVAVAQSPVRPSLEPGDSAKVRHLARSLQGSFETFRRLRLPRAESHGGTCDVRIGRYCYWRGDDHDKEPPPESKEIVARRGALIEFLDSAVAMLPADGWIAAQRVRYLVESGRTDDALAAARRCAAERWWCDALAGYAAHQAARFGAADSAYALALGEMPDAQRCNWLDLSVVVDGDLEKRFQRAGCAARDSLARRVLFLAAPMYSVSATELRTEHFARLTRARMAEESASTDGEFWADDERDLMVRYGWPRWFTRTEPAFGSQTQATITGHDAGVPYDFVPAVRAIDSVRTLRPDDWRLEDPRATAGYSPPYARSMHDIPAQVASFRRGDSTLVLASWDARADTTLRNRDAGVALVLASPESILVTTRATGRDRGIIEATADGDPAIASLEMLAAKDRRAARFRVGLPARASSSFAISDLLLYAPTDSSVVALAQVRDSAVAGTVIRDARALGVFWETYGLAGERGPVDVSLIVQQGAAGWMRRAAERLHLADPGSGLRVQWREVPTATNGVVGRGLRLDLSRLRSGRYRVEVRVTSPDGRQATASRDFELR